MGNPFRRRNRRNRRNRGGCDACDVCDLGCDLFLLSPLVMFQVLLGALRPGTIDPHTAPPRSTAGRWGSRLIRSYQLNYSASRPAVCNLTPSCSRYGLQAVSEHGLLRGVRLIRARTKECGRVGRARCAEHGH